MRVWVAVACAYAIGAGAAQADDISYGTGIYLNENGDVLTNRHVVKSCSQLVVKNANGQSFPASVVAESRGFDMAVIHAAGFAPPAFASIGTGAGAPVNVVYGGFDRGIAAMNFAEGAVVAAPADLALPAHVSVMASDAEQGASGSGVFEENRGALIGLIFAGYLDASERARAHRESDLSYGDHLIKFYTADAIARFLNEEAKVEFSRAVASDGRSWAATRDHIYRATVLVLCGR